MNGMKKITRTSSLGLAAILLVAAGLSGCIVAGRGGHYGGHQGWQHDWNDGDGWQGGDGGGWRGDGDGHRRH